ncbi:hypothetical protein DICVIV_13484 [Dictyocaulus viviparus]|uniref:Uncharacterized protein n=1 Tax=Dictyocaulus viviparus TaxID=29172 RepID=A0A0D8X7P2_DICVI|nr:hypothetical protein DICVIV_13484 [Dictyocaulus viviparus]
MLGMMNSASDSVEFYAINRNLCDELNDEDLKTFTEVKQKQNVSYTDDGRRMINGKIVDVESGTVKRLWENALLRGAVMSHIKVDNVETEDNTNHDVKENEASEIQQHPEQPKIEVVQEPIMASVPLKEPPIS